MLGATVGALMSLAEPAPEASACRREATALMVTAAAEADWLKREVSLALLTEARHDASYGREAACHTTLASAREQLTD